jgi:hypothetical protein
VSNFRSYRGLIAYVADGMDGEELTVRAGTFHPHHYRYVFEDGYPDDPKAVDTGEKVRQPQPVWIHRKLPHIVRF